MKQAVNKLTVVTLPSQLPYPHYFEYCIVHLRQFMAFFYLFIYGRLRLQFLYVEINPSPQRPVPTVYRILCSNVRGLAGNLCALTVASSRYDILLCSKTLVSDVRHVSELLVPGFGRPVQLCRDRMPRPQAGCLGPNMYEMDLEHFANPSLSVVVAKCWVLGFVV